MTKPDTTPAASASHEFVSTYNGEPASADRCKECGLSKSHEAHASASRKTKIKYWTACVNTCQRKAFITATGLPFTNLRDAKRHMRSMHSSNAAVVQADSDEQPTTYIVATGGVK